MKVEEKHGVADGCSIEEAKAQPFSSGFQEKKNERYREIKHHLHLDSPQGGVDRLHVVAGK